MSKVTDPNQVPYQRPNIICGYIPTYEALDFVVKDYETKINQEIEELVVYIDVKNSLYGMYYEESILNTIRYSKATGSIDCGIIPALLRAVKFHKMWNAKKHDKKYVVKLVFYFESGKSHYHHRLNKNYKSGRAITDFSDKCITAEDMQEFGRIVRSNLDILDKVTNAIPNVYCCYLKNIDADFVPHYFCHTKKLAENPRSLHLIYSNDKDMGQALTKPNVMQYIRKKLKKDVLNESGEVIKRNGTTDHIYLNSENVSSYHFKESGSTTLPANMFSICLSLLGDTADGIQGVNGIGPKTAIKVFDDLLESGCGDKITNIDTFIEQIKANLDATKYKSNYEKIIDKEDILRLAWKQIDFEELIRNLDITYIDKMDKIMNKGYIKEITNMNDLNVILNRTLGVNYNNI